MKKKGFTLIELLAVIVILAIIAVIATPIITGIIEDSKKAAFNRSVEGIIKGLEFDVAFKLGDNGYTYKIEDGDIEELKYSNVSISNTKGFNGTVIYDSEANVSYAIHNDKWCAMKIGNDITTTDYIEGECVIANPEACFVVEDTSIAVSYEIGDNCENYFVNNNDWWLQEEATNYCNGGTNSYGYNLKEDILSGYLDIEELQTNNVIKNVVMKDGVSITDYDIYACGVDVVIPSIINNKEVVAIDDVAFSEAQENAFIPNDKNNIQFMNSKVELAIVDRSDIKSIIIPSTVIYIGYYAFEGNQLTSVIIPSSVTSIGQGAFSGNQLTSVVIPNGVTLIGLGAFSGNQLTSVVIPSSVTSIGGRAFEDNQLTSIVIPNSVTSIGESAFEDNQLTNVTIPSSVTSIGEWAFGYNQLTNVTIPSSVTSIGEWAFGCNQLTNVTIPSSVTSIGDAAFNNNQLPDNEAFIYKRNSDGSIDNTTIVSYGGAKRNNVTIPNSVIIIGEYAFRNNQLNGVAIPSSVTSIGQGAFEGNQLTSVEIPNSVTSIGEWAFGYNQLTTITIPSSVTIIGKHAFFYNNLTSVTIPSSVISIGDGAFDKSDYSNPNLTTIINKTDKSFHWGGIIIDGQAGYAGYNFKTGTVVSRYGNVEITSE